MGNYTGPKVRLTRRLGVPICETNKHLNPRKGNRPGMHGFRRGRPSLYGRQLAEKQKIACYYNVRDKQLRHYMERASTSKKDNVAALTELLETRLDNTVRRLGWARTIWQARQAVAHGHFFVNGHKVDRPSYNVRVGDVITVRESSQKFVKDCAETCEGPLAPEWLQLEENKLEGRVVRMPAPEDVRLPFEVEYGLVVEYYGR
jgi:small subunit ribosomal protein S4